MKDYQDHISDEDQKETLDFENTATPPMTADEIDAHLERVKSNTEITVPTEAEIDIVKTVLELHGYSVVNFTRVNGKIRVAVLLDVEIKEPALIEIRMTFANALCDYDDEKPFRRYWVELKD